MKKPRTVTFLVLLVVLSSLATTVSTADGFRTLPSSAGPLSAVREFTFTYSFTIQVPQQGSSFSVHVPMPRNTPWQRVISVQLSGNFDPNVYHDAKHGNRILRYDVKNVNGRSLSFKQTYRIRRTRRNLTTDGKPPIRESMGSYYPEFLDHHQYMVTNDRVREIARSATEDSNSYMDNLRSLYDRVREIMKYDKSGHGWGKGDIRYCLRVGKGNCTDFHTLFASLAREQGIPTRFIMGFPIPRTTKQGTVGGYHCWVESYVPGEGWFPMDISEADKHPKLVDFYFGTLDADRIQFTTGKNIPLSTGKRVNYLIYPVVDGNNKVKLKKSFSFKNSQER